MPLCSLCSQVLTRCVGLCHTMYHQRAFNSHTAMARTTQISRNTVIYIVSLCLSSYSAMGPRAVPLSARMLCFRLPSDYQFSVLPSLPLSRSQPLRKATHCSHRFASMSSVFASTPASAVRQRPLPMGLQLKSSLGKCYVIDEVLSERPAAGRIWCVFRAMY